MSPTTTVEAFAPAKVNLTLHVTGRRADGYHLLDSLVVFTTDVGDRITVRAAEALSLKVTGPMADGVPVDGDNLVLRAAERLASLRGVDRGAAITLEKHLPHGGGIGGGSADAAAAIRALAELWEVAPLSTEEALPLGADLPVCLAGPGPQRMRGIGDLLDPVAGLPGFGLLMANPGIPVPTADVFCRFARDYGQGRAALSPLPEGLTATTFRDWLRGHGNDLTKSARDVVPGLEEVSHALRRTHPLDTDMSGSGGTHWALFATRAEAAAAAAAVSARYPGWWVRATEMAGG